jgi:hypothetical protein
MTRLMWIARRGVLIASVFLLAFAVRVSAEPPHQADIDACNREGASVGPVPAASSNEQSAGATARRETNATTDENAAAAQPTTGRREAAATPLERQAFAACLARHGYYKGYYH